MAALASRRGRTSQPWFAVLLTVLLLAGSAARTAHAADWPQWRGPRRDGVSTETNLLASWPAGGPRLAFHADGLGTGYASVVVSRGKVFTIGRKESDVVATALDAETGNTVWTRTIGTTSRHPSSTPTVDDDRLYALDPDGELVCLNVSNGEILWQKSFVDDFGGKMMSGRGYGESPLVDGDRLICTPGGPEAAMVALDKRTGEVIWKAKLPAIGPGGREGAGFASAVISEAAGIRQYVQLMGRGVVGIAAKDGRFLWSYNAIANDTANIPTPVVQGDYVFAANGYTAGSVLLKLVRDDAAPNDTPGVKAEVVYALQASQFQNHHGGVILFGNHLYGGHGNNNGLPTCLDFETGKVRWKRRGPGVGSAAAVCAEGRLYFRYQNGLVALIEATDAGYILHGTLEVPGAGGDSWAHPVVANGRLYLREQDALWVYDIRADGGTTTAETDGNAEDDAEVAALRKLGATVERFEPGNPKSGRQEGTDRAPPTPKKTSERGGRLYEFAIAREPERPASENGGKLRIVTLNDRQLTSEGTIAEGVLAALKRVRGPFVVNLAGTRISDAGLASLSALDNIVGLNLELCGRISDAGLERLAAAKQLRVLSLSGTAVTHAGLEHFAAHPNLVALDIEVCDGITDAACEPLGRMRQLRALVFKKTGFEKQRISDAGLDRLKDLKDLELLDLYGNNLTDAGLERLQAFPRLRELNLSLLAISDAGLPHLKPLARLERLELLYSEGFAGPKITDAGAMSLTPLSNLTALNLTGAKITDNAMEALASLEKLKTLQLVRTKVTSNGVKAFQSAVPGCEVVR